MEVKGIYTGKTRMGDLKAGECFVTDPTGGDPWMIAETADGKRYQVAIDNGFISEGLSDEYMVYPVKVTATVR